MKRLLIYFICGIICSSCTLYGEINLEIHHLEVDYRAQDVILRTDGEILSTGFYFSESDVKSNHYEEYDSDTRNILKGEWFSLIVDYSNQKQLRVALNENTTGKDRKVKVSVERRIDNDSVVIVQKAKTKSPRSFKNDAP